jgi:Polysaccharide deacetylase
VSLIGHGRRTVARAFRGPAGRAAATALERLARAPGGSFAVLTYHRVDDQAARPWLYPSLLSATPDAFEDQMQALQLYHAVIGLTELVEARRGERVLPAGAVLVTFDDAYTDFRANAWPVLKRLGLPVTLFVPTAYPDAPDRSFWWDRVWQAVTESRVGGELETSSGRMPIRNDRERLGSSTKRCRTVRPCTT